jgi:hypothetical protein
MAETSNSFGLLIQVVAAYSGEKFKAEDHDAWLAQVQVTVSAPPPQ